MNYSFYCFYFSGHGAYFADDPRKSNGYTRSDPTDQTRVIIFSEKRDSVREITELLEQDQPLVKPMSFIGQATSHAAGRKLKILIKIFL